MANTAHLGITLLEQSQASKEITINEALARIDAALNSGVIDRDLATPPASPAAGDVYIVAASPTGAWSGKTGQVAYFDQLWRFIVPNEGLTLWVNDENVQVVHNGTAWQVISPSMLGTTTNDNAAAGMIGEFVSTTLPLGSAITPVHNTVANITSITLSAGDWDVSGEVQINFSASTTYSYYVAAVSTASATLPNAPDISRNGWSGAPQALATAIGNGFVTGVKRVSLASTTTVYLVFVLGFSAGSPLVFGTISARRAR